MRFCPKGYISTSEAILVAWQCWFERAEFRDEEEAHAAINLFVKVSKDNSIDALVQDIEKLPIPDELRQKIDPISMVATIDLLRHHLHQGKANLRAYRFEADGAKANERHFWATPE